MRAMPYPEVLEGAVGRYERWDPARHTEAFAQLCADPEVMEFIGGPATRAVTEETSERIADHWDTFGFGLWAAIERTSGRVAGFAGACRAMWLPGFEHETELGWRLARWAWGHGLATEGGALAMEAVGEHLEPDGVIAIIDPGNARSLAVAQRLGLAVREETLNPRLGKPILILARMLSQI
jgi:RimJ/RimL family protein N-acetyltransferase